MRRLVPLVLASAVLIGCDLSFTGPVKISSVVVDPAEVTIAENQVVTLTAVVRDALGNVTTDQPTWYSRNPDVLQPMEYGTGRMWAAGLGTTVVEATVRGQTGRATVTVIPGTVSKVTVYPDRTAIVVGQKFLISVAIYDDRGMALRSRPATYTSNDPMLLSVSSYGEVTGLKLGIGSITVTVEGKSTAVTVKVVPNTVTYNFYKRGGTTTPGVATLTYFGSNIQQGTLAIDGKSLPVQVFGDFFDGAICFLSQYPANYSADGIGGCASNSPPTTMRLCNGAGQLQYILMPVADSMRVASTASALLTAVQSNTAMNGIGVHNNCASGPSVTRLVRNTPGTDFFFLPSTTVYPAASVAAMLDGMPVFSHPTAGNAFNMYFAVRMTPTTFELWH